MASATVIAIDEVRHPQGMWVMNIVLPLRALHLSFAGRGRGACREMGGGEENLRYVGFGVVAVVVLAVASALIYRKYLQHETGEQRAIRSAQGIESLEAVSIGGIRQWVEVCGENVENPILLFIHGGPGIGFIPMGARFQGPWEKTFTVVQWDQRGAGNRRTGAAAADDERGADGAGRVGCGEFWQRFHRDKIFVVGHS